MNWTPRDRLLTVEEAALTVERPESTIRRWIAEERLSVHSRNGRRALILEADILEVDGNTRRGRRSNVTPT